MDQATNITARELGSPILGHAVRWVASIHLVSLVAQVAAAPAFLAGYAAAFALHRANATVVLALGVVLALAALANGPKRTGPWLTLIAVAIPALEATQIWLGQSGQTAAHVLIGLTIWSLSIAFAVKVWAAVRAV